MYISPLLEPILTSSIHPTTEFSHCLHLAKRKRSIFKISHARLRLLGEELSVQLLARSDVKKFGAN